MNKPKTKKIIVGFSTARKTWKPLASLIRFWWGTKYSHVYLSWETPWGFREILEASGSAVRMREYEIWKKENKIIKEYEIEITRGEFAQVMIQLRSQTGKPYSWGQIIGLVIAELFKLKKNPIQDGPSGWICSEVGLKFLQIIGFAPKTMPRDRVVPKDIEDILNARDRAKIRPN